MKKIIPIKHEKIWGYESWLHSPLTFSQSQLETGEKIIDGPLIKIIKADQPLSVQVHPDDELARELENEDNGKSECWYVLDKTDKSEFIVGLNNMDKQIIRDSFANKTFQNILKKIVPEKEQFINIPAGLVHGVGAQSKVLEVQQPSDTTYRFYDYDRLENGKPRDLHIEKSLKSIKDLDWHLEPFGANKNEYKVLNYNISFYKQNITLQKQGIVIDLNEEVGYLAEKDEEVKFKHWAFITY